MSVAGSHPGAVHGHTGVTESGHLLCNIWWKDGRRALVILAFCCLCSRKKKGGPLESGRLSEHCILTSQFSDRHAEASLFVVSYLIDKVELLYMLSETSTIKLPAG
jgi:hypothetical protein